MKPMTKRTLELFLLYAKDAKNWGGTPLVGGNVPNTKPECGRLTHLKRAGLVKTRVDDKRQCWLYFTQTGKALAANHGIIIGGSDGN